MPANQSLVSDSYIKDADPEIVNQGLFHWTYFKTGDTERDKEKQELAHWPLLLTHKWSQVVKNCFDGRIFHSVNICKLPIMR